MRLRGLIWIGIGLALYFGSMAMGRPLLLRFTQIPLGWIIAAIGVIYLVYDILQQKKKDQAGKL